MAMSGWRMDLIEIVKLLSEAPIIVVMCLLYFLGGYACFKILFLSIKNNREREKENQEYNEKREERLSGVLLRQIEHVGNTCDDHATKFTLKLEEVGKDVVKLKEGVERLSFYKGKNNGI